MAAEILLYFGLVNATISTGIGSIAVYRAVKENLLSKNSLFWGN